MDDGCLSSSNVMYNNEEEMKQSKFKCHENENNE